MLNIKKFLNQRINKTLAILLIIIFVIVGGLAVYYLRIKNLRIKKNNFISAVSYIDKYFYDANKDNFGLDHKKVLNSIIDSLADKNSHYVTASEYAKLKTPEVSDSWNMEVLRPGLGYLCIKSFDRDVQGKIKDLKTFIGSNNVDKLIIDLRDNLGGDMYAVINFADEFLTSGVISQEIDVSGATVHRASSQAKFANLKVVVLINKETSSAAEMLAAAISENNRGNVLGAVSYGKGTMQEWIKMNDGSAVKITVGKWLTPKSNSVEGKGFKPDYFIGNIDYSIYDLLDEIVKYF